MLKIVSYNVIYSLGHLMDYCSPGLDGGGERKGGGGGGGEGVSLVMGFYRLKWRLWLIATPFFYG